MKLNKTDFNTLDKLLVKIGFSSYYDCIEMLKGIIYNIQPKLQYKLEKETDLFNLIRLISKLSSKLKKSNVIVKSIQKIIEEEQYEDEQGDPDKQGNYGNKKDDERQSKYLDIDYIRNDSQKLYPVCYPKPKGKLKKSSENINKTFMIPTVFGTPEELKKSHEELKKIAETTLKPFCLTCGREKELDLISLNKVDWYCPECCKKDPKSPLYEKKFRIRNKKL